MTFTVAIAGITGKFGALIAQHILDTPDVKLRGYCRNRSKLAASLVNEARVDVVEGSAYDLDSLRAFVEGSDVVICTYLGDNELMVDGQKCLVDACEMQRVPRYIASDYCFDFTQLDYHDHPAKDPMKIIKAYIETKEHVRGVHTLIGAFMDTFWSSYFEIWNAETETLSYWGSGDEKWESTTYQNAAGFVATVALDAGATGIQKYLGDTKSIKEIAAIYRRVYGRIPRLNRLGTLDQLLHTMRKSYEAQPGDVSSWLAMHYQYYCLNGQTSLNNPVNSYGIKPETFEDFMRRHPPSALGV